MTCCAIRGATALRTPPTKCAGRALFDEDATPCAPSVLSPLGKRWWADLPSRPHEIQLWWHPRQPCRPAAKHRCPENTEGPSRLAPVKAAAGVARANPARTPRPLTPTARSPAVNFHN